MTGGRVYRQPPRSEAEVAARAVRERHTDSRPAMQELAALLGHGGLALERTVSGARWFTSCDCGWVSTTRATESDALGAALHHVKLAIKAWHNTGAALPKTPPARQRPEHLMERRNRHYEARRKADREAAERHSAGHSDPALPDVRSVG